MSDLDRSSTLSSIFSLPDEDEGGHQRQNRQQNQNKLLNVTITILSLTGVHAKETSKKQKKSPSYYKSKFARLANANGGGGAAAENNNDDAANDNPALQNNAPSTTVMVASFERVAEGTEKNDENHGTIMTHVPSLPLPLSPPSRAKNSATFDDVVRWPEQDNDDETTSTCPKVSSFTFQRHFPHETNTNGNSPRKFMPQLVPIQVSVSRNSNGKMYRLGSAHVLVSGEEEGVANNVPVVNFDTAFKPNAASGSGNNISMMRLKGDTLKCGLATRATLKVLVRISEPPVIVPTQRVRLKQALVLASSPPTKTTGSVVSLRSHDPSSVCTDGSECSDASWEYDPTQGAVVLRKKKYSGFTPPSSALRNSTRNHAKDAQSYSTSSTISDSLGSSFDTSSSASNDTASHFTNNAEGEILQIISDISKNGFPNDEDCAAAMSSSVQPFQKKQGVQTTTSMSSTVQDDSQRRRPWDDTEDETTVTSYSSSGESSIATPATSPRYLKVKADTARKLMFPPLRSVYYRGGEETTSTKTSMIQRWTHRLACCGSGATNESTAGITMYDSKMLDSIDEDSFTCSYSTRDDRYSLEGREHSLQTVESDQSQYM